MSEPQHDERTDEPRGVDEVVDSVNASLADAEAASRDAVGENERDESAARHVADVPDEAVTVVAEQAPSSSDAATVAYASTDDALSRYDTDDAEFTARYAAVEEPTALYPAAATEATALYAETVTPSEPVVPVVPVAQQPIFVQAPEAPRPRGNRGAAGAIGLLAAVAFGILYLGVALGLRVAAGEITVAAVGAEALAALTSWWLWVPVAVFFVSFWLLGAIINRGRWGVWVVLGLLVGLASYGGHLLGQLFQAPFWALTARQGTEIVESQILAPLAIGAFVIGRELTIWFGAWVAARGKRVTELNREMQREYERTLEAGPQVRQG